MENRGRKRTESVDQLPLDKRACSSPDSNTPVPVLPLVVSVTGSGGGGGGGACSSSSSLQTHMGSNHSVVAEPEPEPEQQQQPPEIEMDAVSTSSAASISGRLEAEPEAAAPSGSGGGGGVEKESSAYGSCDSDGLDESEHRHNNNNNNNNNHNHEYEDDDDDDDDEQNHYRIDQEKFKKILMSLSEDTDPSNQLSGLTQLCDILAFCTENSISSSTADALSPILVTLAKHEFNPDIMLFAIRAITYLCDVLPRSSGLLVRYDAVPALCSRLLAIEYLDVAEQCLLALEKISADHPLVCLQAGTIMAVLNYIDFFSSSVQRIALATVSNICRKLPSDSTAHFMEAVPVLCNLLQYEDQKLVETVATCLIRIADKVSKSPEVVEELCKHNLIHQVTHLIALNSHTTLSQPVYNGLIGLLSKLAAASGTAVRTLFELNISSTVKHILSSYDVSHGMPSTLVGGDGNSNQVQEVLKLLNVLLPPLERSHDDVVSDKEKILKDQPELLQRFGIDILPVLIQVVNCGANLYVCYGCLSVINKLVYFSRSDMLLDMLKNTNISSFLAGVFARNDHHVLVSALNTVETILQQRPDVFLNSFIKEGVVYAIDAILTPEKSSRFMFPAFSCTHLSSSGKQKSNAKDAVRCLCYSLNIGRPPSSEIGTCKLEKDSAHTLAKRIKATYFATESQNSEIGLTEILQKLRNFCAVLSDKANVSRNDDMCAQQEEKLFRILGQIIMELNAGESVSTFEFIESGIVKSILTYLSNGQYLKGKVDDYGLSDYLLVVLKRFVMFASFSLSPTTLNWEDMPLTVLVRKLQMALSSLENFPVILSHISKPRNTYAAIPTGHYTRHPCLKVWFLNEEGETDLCDSNANVVNVEPFTSFDSIEKFLRPNVSTSRGDQQAIPAGQSTTQSEDLPVPLPSDVLLPSDERSPNSEDLNLMETHNVLSSDELHLDSAKPDPEILPEVEASLKPPNSVNANSSSSPSTSDEDMEHGKSPTSSINEDTPQKLMFYLDGRQLDHTITLYQAILQLQLNEENDMIVGPSFWNEVYKVTYKKTVESNLSNPQDQPNGTQFPTSPNYAQAFCQNVLCFSSTLISELPGNLEKSNPAAYEILLLLKILEVLNKSVFHLMSHDRVNTFAEGKSDNLDSLMVSVSKVPQAEFLSSKLTEKLEQQMGDHLAVSSGCMPSWCSQLISECPFLFSFEARCKYFRLTAFGSSRVQPHSQSQSASNSNSMNDSRLNPNNLPRKKFQVDRNHVLDSAAKMMNRHAGQNIILEVEYGEEVGTGLGPTLEFYTLVSHDFQKLGLGMWRGDHSFLTSGKVEDSGCVVAPLGLFPRPWSTALDISKGVNFSEVMQKFVLLGQVIGKALQDGRVLDIPLSKAFFKLILDQELDIYDIQSFDPSLGRALLEFQALVDKKRMDSVSGDNTFVTSSCFRNTSIDDLYLDFTTLPGYPDYMLTSDHDHKMVTMSNLEQYVSWIVDATVNTGIARQVEAFKSGFNQVFPITSLKIFTEEEIDHLLCGERDAWTSTELLDHIKFDHGYTASSPPIIYLLEIIQEFKCEQQQAFLQFVTGAPRLPHGGLAALNPKMTIVRKHGSDRNGDLPSVMTCANYLKLPSYSSKEIMRERLIYAITEGQGSFHLS